MPSIMLALVSIAALVCTYVRSSARMRSSVSTSPETTAAIRSASSALIISLVSLLTTISFSSPTSIVLYCPGFLRPTQVHSSQNTTRRHDQHNRHRRRNYPPRHAPTRTFPHSALCSPPSSSIHRPTISRFGHIISHPSHTSLKADKTRQSALLIGLCSPDCVN